jgi:glutamate 5-kinase
MNIIIIKIGSALLINEAGEIDINMIKHVINGILLLKNKGFSPVLVTSGAISIGKNIIKNKTSYGSLSAIGQSFLTHKYLEIAKKNNIIIAQYLITSEDIAKRSQYIYLKSSLEEVLNNNILPIINDNDVFYGIRKGFDDNDQLACYLGLMLNAKKILILTSVDGIYKNFNDKNPIKFETVENLDNLLDIDTKGKTNEGTGGMKSKIKSLIEPVRNGIDVYIGKGNDRSIFTSLFDNSIKKPYTYIKGYENNKKLKGIKKWIFTNSCTKGKIIISYEGSTKLKNVLEKKSVLAKGVIKVIGFFDKGDVISVYDENNNKIGDGITKINSETLKEKKGTYDLIVIHADYFLHI